jgi:hypothetical protein
MSHCDYLGLLKKELVIALAVQNSSLLPKQELWPKARFWMSSQIIVLASQGVIKNLMALNISSIHDANLALVVARVAKKACRI